MPGPNLKEMPAMDDIKIGPGGQTFGQLKAEVLRCRQAYLDCQPDSAERDQVADDMAAASRMLRAAYTRVGLPYVSPLSRARTMTTWLRRGEPGFHDIQVDYTADELESAPRGLIVAGTIHPSLWHLGDLVAATATDGGLFRGRVVLIERSFNTAIVQLIPGQRISPEALRGDHAGP